MPKKQKDNRYRAKITVGYDADGVAVYKYVSARTKKELEEAKVAARAHYIDGAVQPQQDRLFSDYVREWYRVKKEPFVSSATKVNYAACLNKHLIPRFGDRNLRSIRANELQEWLNEYAGVAKTTISLLMSILKNVFSTAMTESIVQVNVADALVRPSPKPVDERRALTDDERKAVTRTASTHKEGLFLAALYYLGLRRGEALGLKWGDFQFSERLVHVQRDIDYSDGKAVIGDLKTENADRFVTIPNQLLPLLVNKRGPDDALLFSSNTNGILSYNSYRRMWLRLMIDAGIATPIEPEGDGGEQKEPKRKDDIQYHWDTEITPHYFRHNYITMLYEAGVDMPTAMKLVGHKDIQTTINVYTHLKEQHLRKATAQIDHVFEKLPKSCQLPQTPRLYKKEKPLKS